MEAIASADNLTAHNTQSPEQPATDNTTTFLIGFGVLLIFVLVGVLASAFLCITLKKDPYLWDAERERQLQDKVEEKTENNTKERDKMNVDDKCGGADVVSI